MIWGGGWISNHDDVVNKLKDRERQKWTDRQWSARLNCPPEFCFASANFLTRSMKLQAAIKYCPAICQSTEERQHAFHETGREMSVAGGTFPDQRSAVWLWDPLPARTHPDIETSRKDAPNLFTKPGTHHSLTLVLFLGPWGEWWQISQQERTDALPLDMKGPH